MNKFIKTILFFIIPFIILLIILVFVDPYNILRKEHDLKYKKLKSQISYKINYPLYKLQEYNYNPTDIIILGDSRAKKLNSNFFELVTGEKTMNLAYGGGTIPEIVETFWIANKIHKLKRIYIGVNFNLYNALNCKNRVIEANMIRESLISYLTSKYCIKSTLLILKSIATSKQIEIEKPPFSKEEFWEHQLNVAGPNYFRDYKYPSQYYKDLIKISEYCSQHEIKLIYFIPPTHIDLQDEIRNCGREKENERFIKDLKSLGDEMYDFNYPNDITMNTQNFSDPYHFNDSVSKIVIRIISGDSEYTRTQNNVYKNFSRH